MTINRHTFILLAAAVAGAALATAACEKAPPSARTTLDADRAAAVAIFEGTQPPPRVGARAQDTEVKAKVQMALLEEPNLKSQRIFVDVSDGIVTLSGVVDSVPLRDRAKRIVDSVVGVTPVVDLMVVKATANG